jgi:hypothetical protein
MSQDTDVPSGSGFASSIKLDCTTADASLAGADYISLQYRFEGQHLQHLKKGTASAESVTLSFWVKSVKTGTFTAQLLDADNSRTISQTYTVDSGSTWEKKTLTFAGDTTGAFNNDNAISMTLLLCLAAGSDWTSGTLSTSWAASVPANWISPSQVNIADSTSNDFWITGLQLEVGSSATDFEFVPSDYQLLRCQRYYWFNQETNFGNPFAGGYSYSTTAANIIWHHPVEMRSAPTFTLNLDPVTAVLFYDTSLGHYITSSSGLWANKLCSKGHLLTSGLTTGNGGLLIGAGGANNKFEFSAELG